VFGPQFAQALLQLKPGSWQGPVESGYGWHLVWIEAMTPKRIPTFEEVEPEVKQLWLAERRADTKRKAFEAMRSRYEVVLPNSLTKDTGQQGKRP
jgi:parvulin-like peptidyl-prolyl isomerase